MNFHPQLVHFPIALLFVAGAIYVVSFFREEDFWMRMAGLLHIIGTGGLVAAILSGMQAEGQTIHTAEIHAMIERHAILSYVLVWSYTLLYVWYYLRHKRFAKMEKLGFVAVFVILLGVMTFSAHIGGELVYEQGAGVEPYKPILKEQFQKEQE